MVKFPYWRRELDSESERLPSAPGNLRKFSASTGDISMGQINAPVNCLSLLDLLADRKRIFISWCFFEENATTPPEEAYYQLSSF